MGGTEAAAAKVPLDAPDHGLENVARLAGLQMPETLPDKLARNVATRMVYTHVLNRGGRGVQRSLGG